MEVLIMTSFPMMVYSMQFMMHTKTKPSNHFSGATFLWAFFLKFVTSNCFNFAKLHAERSTKLKKWKDSCNVHCLESFQPINALVDAVVSVIFVPCENQSFHCSHWNCLFMRCFYVFSLEFVLSTTSMLPNFMWRPAPSWKIKTLVQSSLLEKF